MPTILDRVNVGFARFYAKTAGQRQVDVAFVKATNHDDGPPKDKHVKTLLRAAAIETAQSQEYLVSLIEMNLLESTECVVVAKTLVILHKLLREGGRLFRETFYKGFTHLFDHLGNFKDDTSRLTWQLSTFIRAYCAFLHQRCLFFSSFPYETEPSRAQMLDAQALLCEMPVMQAAIDKGIQVGTSSELVNTPRLSLGALQGYAQHLVLGDVLLLSLHMMKATPRIVEVFFEGAEISSPQQNISDLKDLLLIYKESQNLVDRLSNLDESKLGHWGGLSLTVPPSSVLESMTAKVEEMSPAVKRKISQARGSAETPFPVTDATPNSSPDPVVRTLI